jgi:hypothetical protein
MSPLFKKLNLKPGTEVNVFNAPPAFENELTALTGVSVLRDPKNPRRVSFALAFASKQTELDRLANKLIDASVGDVVLWFAYPKGSSKRHTCDFNRDSGWHVIRDAGLDSVRQVAIDEDWSALRFRRVEYIKTR